MVSPTGGTETISNFDDVHITEERLLHGLSNGAMHTGDIHEGEISGRQNEFRSHNLTFPSHSLIVAD